MKIHVKYIPCLDNIQVTSGGMCTHNSIHWDSESQTAHMNTEYEHEVMVDIEVCEFCGSWKQDEYNGWQER